MTKKDWCMACVHVCTQMCNYMSNRTTLHARHSITRTHTQQISPRLLTLAAGSLLLIYQCHTSLPSVFIFSDNPQPLILFQFLISTHIWIVFFLIHFFHSLLFVSFWLICSFSSPFTCSLAALSSGCCALSLFSHWSVIFFPTSFFPSI